MKITTSFAFGFFPLLLLVALAYAASSGGGCCAATAAGDDKNNQGFLRSTATSTTRGGGSLMSTPHDRILSGRHDGRRFLTGATKEYGEDCGGDSECYTGHCSTSNNKCGCDTVEDCFGCTSTDGKLCIRIEQSIPDQPMKICHLAVSNTNSQPIDLVSIGGSDIKGAYSSLPSLESDDDNCVDASTTVDSTTKMRSPAFIQANIDVTDPASVGMITISSTDLASLDGAQLFLGGHWVKTLDLARDVDSTNPGTTLAVPYWERKLVPVPVGHPYGGMNNLRTWSNLAINGDSGALERDVMHVVDITYNYFDGNRLFDFNFPFQIGGVEFVGQRPNPQDPDPTVYIIGDRTIRGRVSFKDVTVDFSNGSLMLGVNDPMRASLIFQNCKLIGFDRCPQGYQEIGGVCYIVMPVAVPAIDASSICTGLSSLSYHPTKNHLFYNGVSYEATLAANVLGGEQVWIKVQQNCRTLDAFGWTTSYSGNDCDVPRGVLCATPVKVAITQNRYTSYSGSDTLLPNWNQGAAYLGLGLETSPGYDDGSGAATARLPIQADGATVTIVNPEFPVVLSTITEEKQTKFRTFLYLKEGDQSTATLAISTDTLGPSHHHNDWTWHSWDFKNGDVLPSKLHLRITSGEVCIANVRIGLATADPNSRSNPGYGILLTRYYFGSCLEYNVCDVSSMTDDPNCGRSLMHHDHSSGMNCARLSAVDSRYPQDISFDLFETSCNRLTTWRDPNLAGSAERIKIKVEVTGTYSGSIVLQAEDSDGYHHYEFPPGTSELNLHDTTTIPHQWRLSRTGGSSGSSAFLKSVKITEYGKTLMEVNFASLFQCINLCNDIASPTSGIDMAKVSVAHISMMETELCGKLSSIDVWDGTGTGTTVTGREMCTMDTTATGFSELEFIVSALSPATYQYRTARVQVIGDFIDGANGPIDLQPFRGLQLFSEEKSAKIQAIEFIVRARSELQIKNFKLTQGTLIKTLVNPDHGAGVAEVIGCHIENHIENVGPQRILSNSGHATFNECVFSEDEIQKIYQFPSGNLDIMYSTLAANVRVETESGSSTRLKRVTLAEGFPFPGTDSLHGGDWELPDSKRFFRPVPGDDPLCTGSAFPEPNELFDDVPSNECKEKCEVDSLCSGFLSFVDDSTGSAKCGLCLNPDPVPYNCGRHAGTSYMIAQSRMDFFKVSGCPAATSTTYTSPRTENSIEICKVFCSFYDTCEGFKVTPNGLRYDCTFFSRLQFETEINCPTNAPTFYIPYVKGYSGFTKVDGASLSSVITTKALPYDQCYKLCLKTLTCKAIHVRNNGNCELYAGNTFETNSATPVADDEKGLFVSLSSMFPAKRYMALTSCQLSDPYFGPSTTESSEVCKGKCDGDISCVAYAYDSSSMDCQLYKRPAVIDSLDQTCTGNSAITIHVAYTQESFGSSTKYYSRLPSEPASALRMEFNLDFSIEDLILNECKALCLQNQDCSAIRHDARTFTCEIGNPSYSASLTQPDEFLVLEAQPADTGSTYLPVPGICQGDFEGEVISGVTLPSYVEPTLGGYTRYPRVCSAAGSSSVLTTITRTIPSTCGRECDTDVNCIGFVYYPDYGEGINDGNVGDCDLLDQLQFDSCTSTVQTDYYLPGRGQTSSTCHAMCNIHRQCSYYIWDNHSGCILYSDMKILSNGCSSGSGGIVIHVGLKYFLNRESFIHASGQCPTSTEDISISDLSLHQCKKACIERKNCRAITFDDTTSASDCRLYNSTGFDGCPASSPSPAPLYIESIEHTYQKPMVNFLGDSVLFNTTSTLTGCKRLCDVYEGCHAIFFREGIDNCQIRGGGAASYDDPIWSDGRLMVAADVALFTEADYLPASSRLTRFSGIFSLDECKTLCDAHQSCDSLRFHSGSTCDLYPLDPSPSFSISDASQSPTRHYVNYESFSNAAKKTYSYAEDLCVAAGTSLPESFSEVNSDFDSTKEDCTSKCNINPNCVLFTLAEIDQSSSEFECLLYDNTASLSECTSSSSSNPNLYVMYIPGVFTRITHGMLSGTPAFKIYQEKSMPECAALCDRHYDCLSYRFDPDTFDCHLSDSGEYSIDPSQSALGDLYVYYTPFAYVEMPTSFCVADKLPYITIPNTGNVEACKRICELMSGTCLSIEFQETGGKCDIHTTSEFSSGSDCTSSTGGRLYIGYEYLYNQPTYLYERLFNCFDTSTASATAITGIADSDACLTDCDQHADCLVAQYDTDTLTCYVFLGSHLPSQMDCGTREKSFLRVKADPYKIVNSTCLRQPITYSSPLINMEEIECQALCDAEPHCRYFLYFELDRECFLFKAQIEELDDCDDYQYPDYQGQQASVNGRTFVDQISYFGDPKDVFAEIDGLSYQECASLCDRLDICMAFQHTWNYRKFSSASAEPPIFRKSRLLRSTFRRGQMSWYMQPGLKNFEYLEVGVLGEHGDDPDRDIRRQSVVLDEVTGHMMFTINPGQCVAMDTHAEFTGPVDQIQDAFDDNPNPENDVVPTCGSLKFADCSDSSVIEFQTEEDSNGRLRLKFTVPNSSSTQGTLRGCLRSMPEYAAADNPSINPHLMDYDVLSTNTITNAGNFLSQMHQYYTNQANPTVTNACEAHASLPEWSHKAVFSRSYGGGDGCGFGDGVKIESELFTWVSEPVRLQNRGTGFCLDKDLNAEDCDTNRNSHSFIYAFNGGELYWEAGGYMQCVTRLADGSIDMVVCDSGTYTLQEQQWTFEPADGLIRSKFDPSKCLSFRRNARLSDPLRLRRCDIKNSQWVEFMTCKLNTYEKSPPMELQSRKNGKCLAVDTDHDTVSLNSCDADDVKKFELIYSPANDRRLVLESDDPADQMCFGKMVSDASIEDSTTGLVDCSNLEDLNYNWLMTIGGENWNIFQWTHQNGTLFCYDVPQPTQRMCSADLTAETSWRKYGLDEDQDYTAVSVRPSALAQDMNDPRLQFQFFLYSPEGYESRLLRNRFSQLEEGVEVLKTIIAQIREVTEVCQDLIDTVQDPITTVSDNLASGASFFGTVALTLQVLERIPHIGPILQNIRLRTVSTQIKNACNRGNQVVGRLEAAVNRIEMPVRKFGGALDFVDEKLDEAVAVIGGLVSYLTQTSYCTHNIDEQEDLYNALQEVIGTTLDIVDGALSFAADVEEIASALNDFPSLMDTDIFGTFRGFRGILRGLESVMEALSFVNFIEDFSVEIPTVSIRWNPWPNVNFGEIDLDLDAIGRLLNRVQRTLTSIPGVGFAWRWLSNAVGDVIEFIFDVIGFDLPDFGIDFDFIDDIKQDVEDAIERLVEGVVSAVDLSDISSEIEDRIEGVLDTINNSLPTELLPVFSDLDCDDGGCLYDSLGIAVYDVDGSLPILSYNGVNVTMPDYQLDWLEHIWSNFNQMQEAFEAFFEDTIECGSYKTVPLNIPETIEHYLGVTLEELGVPACDMNIRICDSLQMDGLATLLSSISPIITPSSSRRLSQSCATDNWSLTMPFPLPTKFLKVVLTRLFKLDEGILGSLLRPHAGDGTLFQWKLYWKHFLGKPLFLPSNLFTKLLNDFVQIKPKLKIVIGCEDGTFGASMSVGSFLTFQLGTTMGGKSPFNWHPTSYFGKKDAEGFNLEDFDQEAQLLREGELSKFACDVEFVWSTYKTVEDYRERKSLTEGDMLLHIYDPWKKLKKAALEDYWIEQVYLADNQGLLNYYHNARSEYDALKSALSNDLITCAIEVRDFFDNVYDPEGIFASPDKSVHYYRMVLPDAKCAGPKQITADKTFVEYLSEAYKDQSVGSVAKEQLLDFVFGTSGSFAGPSGVDDKSGFYIGITREALHFNGKTNGYGGRHFGVPITIPTQNISNTSFGWEHAMGNHLPLSWLRSVRSIYQQHRDCSAYKNNGDNDQQFATIAARISDFQNTNPPDEAYKCPIAVRYSGSISSSFMKFGVDLMSGDAGFKLGHAGV